MKWFSYMQWRLMEITNWRNNTCRNGGFTVIHNNKVHIQNFQFILYMNIFIPFVDGLSFNEGEQKKERSEYREFEVRIKPSIWSTDFSFLHNLIATVTLTIFVCFWLIQLGLLLLFNTPPQAEHGNHIHACTLKIQINEITVP